MFRGTRVPVAALFENLKGRAQISRFAEWFPGVTLAQVRSVLEHANQSLALPKVARVRVLGMCQGL